MNAHWVKLVSVAALALAGTLAVACSSDDDDDDNPGTQGSAGTSGKAGSGGGSGTGGSAGGGSGSAGASGAGGGGMIALPPTDQASLKAALENGGGLPKYLPTFAPAKWSCEDGGNAELQQTKVEFHGGSADTPADARYCSNYNLSAVVPDPTDGWPLGAAAMKETLNGDGDIIEWAYYALKGDGTTWYGTVVVPTDADGEVAPVPQDAAIPDDVTLEFTEGGCTMGACHGSGNPDANEWVIFGDDVAHEDAAMWLEPNPYK